MTVTEIKDSRDDPGPGIRETFWVAFQRDKLMRNYAITSEHVSFAKMNARMIEDRVHAAYNAGDNKIRELLEPLVARPRWNIYRNGSE